MAEFYTLSSNRSNSLDKENFDNHLPNYWTQSSQYQRNKNQELLRTSIKRLSSLQTEDYDQPDQHLKESIYLRKKKL